MTNRPRKPQPPPRHTFCGRPDCGKTFDAAHPYYCIAYGRQTNRYACRHDAACMAWAQGHVVEGVANR